MLGSTDRTELIAFVSSTDLDRARTFYEGVLGFAVEEVNPYACVLRCGDVMLRVTKVDELVPQPFTVLGWRVADARGAVAGLGEKGVRFEGFEGMGQDADGVWTTPGGDLVAWFKDPDGNTLSLTEFASA